MNGHQQNPRKQLQKSLSAWQHEAIMANLEVGKGTHIKWRLLEMALLPPRTLHELF